MIRSFSAHNLCKEQQVLLWSFLEAAEVEIEYFKKTDFELICAFSLIDPDRDPEERFRFVSDSIKSLGGNFGLGA